MARRPEWERIESKMQKVSEHYGRLRNRLNEIRRRCPHKEKTNVANGWRCRACGNVGKT